VIGGGVNNVGGDAAGGGAYGNRNNGPGAAQIESLKEVYLLLSNPPPPATLLLLLFSLLTAGLLVSRLFAMLISRKAVIRSQARNRKKSRLDQTITASSPGSPPTPKENRAGGDMGRSPAAGAKNNSNTAAAAATKSKQQESSISATSSYPFPQMPRSLTGNSVATAFNTTMSPGMGPHDRILPSGTTTPASFAFQPQGTQPITPFENPDFPTPNMYDLALLLHSEAGIDAFWSNIVKIATTCYKAERVTLAVPSDSTDLENTPWGQKATFNVAEDDCLSLTYMGDERGFVGDQEEASMGEDSDGNHGVPIPKERNNTMDMNGRMEGGFFGGMCDPDEDNTEPIQLERNSDEPFAPVTIGPSDPHSEDANNSDWLSETSGLSPLEPPQPPPLPPEFGRQKQNMAYAQGIEEDEQRGRVFPTLQPLNYEADALLDGTGVSRVLQRGKVVVLGREYRDIKTHLEERDKRRREAEFVAANTPKSSPSRAFSNEQRPKPKKGSIPEQASIQGVEKLDLSSISSPLQLSSQPPTPLYFVGKGMRRKKKSAQKDGYRTHNPMMQLYSAQQHLQNVSNHSQGLDRASSYEEYEQALTSPWSQSPAPSPAPKQDPTENPFFAPPKVDEETFNPQSNSPVYSAQEPVNAIGFESAWTVIHIPLIHPSFSKSLNPSASAAAGGGTATSTSGGESPFRGSFGLPNNDILSRHNMAGHKKSPIAILSMLSPVIPYPRNLIHSLSHFAPLAATAFSLAQNHSNVVNQLSHLQYRRPLRRHAPDIDSGLHSSLRYGLKSPDIVEGASVTSPSELSTMSKDSTSRVASPGWDIGGLGGPRQQGSDQESIRSQASTPVSPGGENLEGYFQPPREKRKIFSRQNSGNIPTYASIRAAAAAAMATTKIEGSTVSLEVQLQMEEDEGASSAGTVKFKKGEQGAITHKREIPRSSPLPDHVLKDLADSEKTPVLEDLGSQSSGTVESPSVSPGSESAPNRRRFPRKRKPALKIVGHNYPHTLLHSYGADYSATFQSLAATTSLPGTPLGTGRRGSTRMSTAGATSQNHQMPPPSNKLLRTIIDSIPVHVFTAAPYTGETTWVNARMLAYRGATVDEFMKGPWEAFHPDDREDYIKRWGIAVRKGEPFSHQVRVRRFDGVYRWFMIRAVPLRDSRGIIVHWFGTNMDIHDQRIAEVDAARQAEMAESESKYRSLANSSPQIVFAATAVDGISYANTQWLGYSGQTLAQALRLGFMEHVHPNDRYKCALPGLAGGGGSVSPRSVSPGGDIASPGFETSGFSPNSYGSSAYDGGFKDPTGVDIEEEKPTFSTELRLRDKHGNYRWHLVRCVSVETNFGTGEGQWFGTCTDINDHKLLEQKLKEANEAAQKTMESKTRFLANMSHEIREYHLPAAVNSALLILPDV
jgi:PAS domain S-box-containing protein